MADFVARLDEINALAESSPGFVWRLKDDHATVVQAYPEETMLVNVSVWETPEDLHRFVYRSAHRAVLRRKKEWFEKPVDAHLALWWIAPDHIPTIDEAKERLAYLQHYGESEFAFSFATLLAARGADGSPLLTMPPVLDACGAD